MQQRGFMPPPPIAMTYLKRSLMPLKLAWFGQYVPDRPIFRVVLTHISRFGYSFVMPDLKLAIYGCSLMILLIASVSQG